MLRKSVNLPFLVALIIFCLSFSIYTFTLAPTVLDSDRAEFQFMCYRLGIPHPTGYPLYIMLGKIFTFLPLKDVAFRINLMSAFWGALAVSVLYLASWKLTQNHPAAIVASFSFAFSRTLWMAAIEAEVYSLLAFFSILLIYLALLFQERRKRNFLYGGALLLGLNCAHHFSALTLLPGLIFRVCQTSKRELWNRKILLIIVLSFVIGLSPYLFIFVRDNSHLSYRLNTLSRALGPSRETLSPSFSNLRMFWERLYWLVSNQILRSEQPLFSFSLLDKIKVTLVFLSRLFLQFPLLGFLLGIIGLRQLKKKNVSAFQMLLIMFLSNVIFFTLIGRGSLMNFWLPAYLIFALWLGEGAAGLFSWLKNRFKQSQFWQKTSVLVGAVLIISFPLATYASLPKVFRTCSQITWMEKMFKKIGLEIFSKKRIIPTQRGNFLCRDYGMALLQFIEENGMINAQWNTLNILLYFQTVYGLRQDIDFSGFSENSLKKYFPRRPLCLFYCNQSMRDRFDNYYFLPEGPIFRVTRREPEIIVKKPSIGNDLNLIFGGKIKLLGYNLKKREVDRGEIFAITYFWELIEGVKKDFRIETEFWNQDYSFNPARYFEEISGDISDAHQPGYGYYPISRWRKGQVIKFEDKVYVPSLAVPGYYDLQVWIPQLEDKKVRVIPKVLKVREPRGAVGAGPVLDLTVRGTIRED